MSDTSTLFELLAADARRRVLLLLYRTDSVRVPEGVDTRSATGVEEGDSVRVAPGGPGASPSTGQGNRSLELQLTHNHLPKLEGEGLVEWDREEGVVSRGPEFGEVEPVLGVLLQNADAFSDGLV